MEHGNEEERYVATWGIKCHGVQHKITEHLSSNLNIWESGSAFLRQFPYYMKFMTNEADLVVYTVSIDNMHESAGRTLDEFLNPLASIVQQARSDWIESMVEEAQRQQKIEEGLKPKEIIMITGCETYLLHSTEKVELIRAFAEENGIEMCKELAIPD